MPHYRWLLVLLAWLMAFVLRAMIVAASPVLPLIQADLRLSYVEAGVLFTLPVLLMGVLGIPGGWLADRIGGKRSIALGLLLVVLGGVWRALSADFFSILLPTILFASGVGLAQPGLPRLIRDWFPDKPATATGMYSSGFQVGAGAAALLGGTLFLRAVGEYSWRGTLMIWAGVALVGLLLWIGLARSRASDHPPAPAIPAGVAGVGSRTAPRRRVHFGLAAWLTALLFAGQGIVFYLLSAWLPTLYYEMGWDLKSSALPLAAFTLGMVPFTIALPYVSDRISARRPFLIYGSLLMLVANTVLAVAPGWAPWLWSALSGLGVTVIFALCLALPLELADARDVGVLTGFVLTVGYTGSAIGPYVAGLLRDLLGSFSFGLWFCVGVSFLMLLAALRMPETAGRTAQSSAAEAG